MHADDPIGIFVTQLSRDERANIATLRCEAVIAKPRHKLDPQIGSRIEEDTFDF